MGLIYGMGIPTILLMQIVIDLEQKRNEGKIREYVEGVIELVSLECGKSIDEVKRMSDDEFMSIYIALKKRLEDKDVMDKIIKFFQTS